VSPVSCRVKEALFPASHKTCDAVGLRKFDDIAIGRGVKRRRLERQGVLNWGHALPFFI
jgi:hypothetical protein